MLTQTIQKNELSPEKLKAKAALLDEVVELIEDKYFGIMMEAVEGEETLSLEEARKLLA